MERGHTAEVFRALSELADSKRVLKVALRQLLERMYEGTASPSKRRERCCCAFGHPSQAAPKISSIPAQYSVIQMGVLTLVPLWYGFLGPLVNSVWFVLACSGSCGVSAVADEPSLA